MSYQAYLDHEWIYFVSGLKEWLKTTDANGYRYTRLQSNYHNYASEALVDSNERLDKYDAAVAKRLEDKRIQVKRRGWLRTIERAFGQVERFNRQLVDDRVMPKMTTDALAAEFLHLKDLDTEHPSHDDTTANSLAHEIPVARGFRFSKIYGRQL